MTRWLERRLLAGAAAFGLMTAAGAQAGLAPGEQNVTVVTPVFHQLVVFHAPSRLNARPSEQKNIQSYLRESVQAGETVDHWTELLTLTGVRGARANSALTAVRAAQGFAAGFERSCPNSFTFQDLGARTVSGAPADAVVVGCGTVVDDEVAPGQARSAPHSETALIVAILGQQDLYTIQWAERGVASPTALPYDAVKWEDRLKTLEPIKLCPVIAGEKPPYASCTA